MNISEANATSRVLRWVLGKGGDSDRARIDAMWLADRASKTLHAGVTPDDVAQHWPGPEPRQAATVAGALHRSAEADVSFVVQAIEAWQDGADPGDTLRAIRDQLAGKTPGDDRD